MKSHTNTPFSHTRSLPKVPVTDPTTRIMGHIPPHYTGDANTQCVRLHGPLLQADREWRCGWSQAKTDWTMQSMYMEPDQTSPMRGNLTDAAMQEGLEEFWA